MRFVYCVSTISRICCRFLAEKLMHMRMMISLMWRKLNSLSFSYASSAAACRLCRRFTRCRLCR